MHDSALDLPRVALVAAAPGRDRGCGPARRAPVLRRDGGRRAARARRLVRRARARHGARATTCCAGSASLALLALAAFAYPRLPAGGRAALAAVLGVARARRSGARDRRCARGRRPRRGLDRLPARSRSALVLLALAAVAALALAQARPVSLPPPSRDRAREPSLAAYWLVVPVAIGILATHRPRAAVEPADLGRPYQEVTLRTSDGLDLAAWYVPSRNGAAVISYPTRQGKLPQARMLVRHGYGVLLLDARGYDGSEGDPNLFGWESAKDIDAAVAWLQRRPDVDGRPHRRHRLLGRRRDDAPGRGLQHRRSAPSSRRAPACARSASTCSAGRAAGSRCPAAAVQTAAVAVLSGTTPPPSLTDLVPRIAPRPLLPHLRRSRRRRRGAEPRLLSCRLQPRRRIWKIAEAGHVGGFEARPREYEQRVTALLRPRAARPQGDPSPCSESVRQRNPSSVFAGNPGVWH